LLNKEAFCWTKEETKYFEKLKEAMCMKPFLTTLDITNTFIMECDSSEHGISVVLMQEGRPISFEINQRKGKNHYSNPFMKNKCWP
jgi:hypothetical protein